MEIRNNTLPVELRGEGDDPKRIAGTAAVYYREDDAGTEFQLTRGIVERIMPGAFDQAIERDDVRAFFNHDHNLILGRSKQGQGTLTLSLGERGLNYDIQPSSSRAYQDTVEALQRGDVDGSSFAFVIPEGGEEWRMDTDRNLEIREIKQVTLYDVGPVVFPAYDSASSGVRLGIDHAMQRRAAWLDCMAHREAKMWAEMRRRQLAMIEMGI